MTTDAWLDIMLRIAPQEPLDLDPALFAPGPSAGMPDLAGPVSGLAPSPALWPRPEDAGVRIGVRVYRPVADRLALATRLAAIAIERGIQPVILSSLPSSGFEPMGLRVERLSADDPEERRRQEEELSALWDFVLVIDASEIDLLS